MSKSIASHDETASCSGQDYDDYIARMNARVSPLLDSGEVKAFETSGERDLFAVYLSEFPEGERPFHNCSACKAFIRRFGGLVTVSPDGRTKSLLWDEEEAPAEYRQSVQALRREVESRFVSGVHLSDIPVWGTPFTGNWTHYAIAVPSAHVYRGSVLKTASQAAAEKLEDFHNVSRALGEFSERTLEQAVTLLRSDALYRSEKVLGQAEWLLSLRRDASLQKNGRAANVIWRAVASAPAGFCHPRSSMIGTLLEDLEGGLSVADVSRRFAAKMNPLQYQRPQAAPAAGNLEEAERVVAKLGLAGSLGRRFARLDEVQAVWLPEAPKPAGGGVFSHIKPKGPTSPAPIVNHSVTPITWDKFARTVLPEAVSLEVLVPSHGSFIALVTAENQEAPPILQWDREEARNPVSWYLYSNGSPASRWGLRGGEYRKVNAVTLQPSMWNGGFEHQGKSAIFIIDGAMDSQSGLAGLGLFPEILRSEFHGIRASIEAYSRSKSLSGATEGSACGISFVGVTVRAASKSGVVSSYKLDRWD